MPTNAAPKPAAPRPRRRPAPVRHPAALWALLRAWENDYQHHLSTYLTTSDADELSSLL